tara:strand:- start:691 stop:1308 length:618 start_codon:yes stop_codon:yes gene_type:complete
MVWCFYYLIISDQDNKIFGFIHKLQSTKIIDGKSRIINSSHAIILSFYSSLYLLNFIRYDKWWLCLPICSSFGLFDLSLVIIHYNIFKKGYLPILIHHNLLIFGPLLVTEENSLVMARAFLFEVSVPILDFGWFLYHMQKKETRIFKINAFLSILSFFFFRVANSSYLLISSFKYNIYIQCVSITFFLLNIHWFVNLIKLFVKNA